MLVKSWPLPAYAEDLSWLDGREDLEHRRDERHKMRHSVGGGPDEKYTERQCGDVLLKFQAPVHSEQHVVLAAHASQQGAVLQTGPAPANNGVDLMAVQHRRDVYGEMLVKKDAHRPAP